MNELNIALSNLPDFAVFVVVAFAIVTALLWMLLPFAVFGVKAYLKESNKIQTEMLNTLKSMNEL